MVLRLVIPSFLYRVLDLRSSSFNPYHSVLPCSMNFPPLPHNTLLIQCLPYRFPDFSWLDYNRSFLVLCYTVLPGGGGGKVALVLPTHHYLDRRSITLEQEGRTYHLVPTTLACFLLEFVISQLGSVDSWEDSGTCLVSWIPSQHTPPPPTGTWKEHYLLWRYYNYWTPSTI